ncbi:MAG: hypothetical protein LUD81_07825, partial [Clostridiales bacterium]|nr:hypothetical protein [Clostridiales bacterium]
MSFGNYTSISSAVNGNYSTGSHRGLLELTPALDGTLTINFCYYIGYNGSNENKQAYIAVKNSDGSFSVLGAAVYKEYSVSAEVNAGTTYYLITHGTTPSVASIVLTQSDTPVSYTEYEFSGTIGSENEYTDDFVLSNNGLYFTAAVSGSEYSFLYTVKDGTSYDNEVFALDIPSSYTSSVSTVTASAVSGKNEYTFDGSVEYLLKNAEFTFTSALGSGNEYTDSLYLTFNNKTYTASVSGSAYTFTVTTSRDAFAVGDEFTISAVSGYEGTETVKITAITGSAVDGYSVELESIELKLVIYDFVITGEFGSDNEYNTPGDTFSVVEYWYENSTEATTEYVMTISDDGKSYSCSVDDLHSIHFSSTGGSRVEVVSPEGYTAKPKYIDFTTVKGDAGYTVTMNGIVFTENTVLYTLTGALGSDNEYTGSSFELTYGDTTYTAEISGSTYSFDVEVKQSAGAPFAVGDQFTVSVPNGYTGSDSVAVEALSGTDYELSSVSFQETMTDYTLSAYLGDGNEYSGDSFDISDGTNTYTLTKDGSTGAYSITVSAKTSADAPFTSGQSVSVVNPEGYTASASSYTVSYDSSNDVYVISGVVFIENTVVYTLTG